MSILLTRWPAACKAQGWNKNDRELRLQVISEAVGREISSMNDLDNSGDIDKVYAHLGQLADHVDSTVETLPTESVMVCAGPLRIDQQDTNGYRRRLFWLIRKESHSLGGMPYVLRLARGKFHITEGLTTIDDLTTQQLHQLMITIHARSIAKTKSQTVPVEVQEPELQTVSDNEPF